MVHTGTLMGFFSGVRKGKADNARDIRSQVTVVKEVIKEMQEVMGDLPPTIRDSAKRAFAENVGESIDDTFHRLVRLERRLLSAEIEDVPRQELSALRDRMNRLDIHLTESYFGAKGIPQRRVGRKAVKATLKQQSAKVEVLIKSLDRALR
jgi:hypothetical protein